MGWKSCGTNVRDTGSLIKTVNERDWIFQLCLTPTPWHRSESQEKKPTTSWVLTIESGDPKFFPKLPHHISTPIFPLSTSQASVIASYGLMGPTTCIMWHLRSKVFNGSLFPLYEICARPPQSGSALTQYHNFPLLCRTLSSLLGTLVPSPSPESVGQRVG